MLRSIGSEPKPLPPAVHWSHPQEEQLKRFMRGELSLPEVRQIVRHMLSGCTECLKVTRPLWALMQKEPKRLGGRRW
jgi:hypothetical protein